MKCGLVPVGLDVTTVGIIGAGKVGTALGRLALNAGWDVLFTDAADPVIQELKIATMVPGARLVPFEDLVAAADLVIIAVPIGHSPGINWDALGSKIVVDTLNHWYPVDGPLPWLEEFGGPTAELTQSRNPARRVVKSLNHLGYHDMETDARPAGDPLRRALAAASDDAEARSFVARFIDQIGFDPVEVPMAAGKLLETDGPVFGVPMSADELAAALDDAADRSRDFPRHTATPNGS